MFATTKVVDLFLFARDFDTSFLGGASDVLNSSSSGLLADNLFLGGSVNGALGCTHTVKTWLSLKRLGSGAHGTLSPQVLGVTTAILLHLFDC